MDIPLHNSNLGAHFCYPYFLITSISKSLYYQNDAQFLTAPHFTKSPLIIFFGYVDFCTPRENSTTCITIVVVHVSIMSGQPSHDRICLQKYTTYIQGKWKIILCRKAFRLDNETKWKSIIWKVHTIQLNNCTCTFTAPKTIRNLGIWTYVVGEYGKHHVSHHVATPKLYDLGDAKRTPICTTLKPRGSQSGFRARTSNTWYKVNKA